MSIKTFIPSGFPGEREIIIPADLLDSIINNPVTEQLYVTHIGYYPNAKCHYRERPIGAEQYIFIYCENGIGWVGIQWRTHDISQRPIHYTTTL